MPDGVNIPGGPSFVGSPKPPDVPCDPTGEAWRGPPGPAGPQGPPGVDGTQGLTHVVVADAAPVGAPDSTLWWDSAGTGLYVRYNDGSSTQWVVAENQVPTPQGGLVNVLDHGAKGDGTTDDTAAIQSALNTYAGKAVVLLPDTGHPFMVSPLYPPTGTSLMIMGTLKQQPNVPATIPGHPTAGVLAFENVNNILISGTGTIDGNNANQSLSTQGLACISVYNCNNVTIRDVTMQNAWQWNFNALGSSHVLLDSVTILGGNNSPEFAAGCTDCWIMNSYVNGPAQDGGWAFYGGIQDSGAIGNVFTNAFEYGCTIISDLGQSVACQGITIANNLIFSNGFTGIAILSPGSGAIHSRITVSNNVLYSNNTRNIALPGPYPAADIWASGCQDVVISGNKCSGCGNGSNPSYGIIVGGFGGYPAASYVTVTGNDISNEGKGSTTGIGIFLAPNLGADIMISGNHVYDNQGTQTMLHGIAGTCSGRSAIIGNHFGAFIGAAVSVTTNTDTAIANAQYNSYTFGGNTDVMLAQPLTWLNASGVARWAAGNDGSTESGSNTGSSFGITAQLDSGSVVTTLGISRATSQVTLQVAPRIIQLPVNAANDAAAAAAGVQIGTEYRNGSVKMIRVV